MLPASRSAESRRCRLSALYKIQFLLIRCGTHDDRNTRSLVIRFLATRRSAGAIWWMMIADLTIKPLSNVGGLSLAYYIFAPLKWMNALVLRNSLMCVVTPRSRVYRLLSNVFLTCCGRILLLHAHVLCSNCNSVHSTATNRTLLSRIWRKSIPYLLVKLWRRFTPIYDRKDLNGPRLNWTHWVKWLGSWFNVFWLAGNREVFLYPPITIFIILRTLAFRINGFNSVSRLTVGFKCVECCWFRKATGPSLLTGSTCHMFNLIFF